MNFERQADLLAPTDCIFPVTIIGMGGIGSPTALALAKIGCPDLTFMDFDTVGTENIPNQLFRPADVGKPKVTAAQEMVSQFVDGCEIKVAQKKFTKKYKLHGIVVMGVDKMSVRKEIWRGVKYNTNVPLVIDGRLGGAVLQVLTIQPCSIDDIEFYEQYLFSDKEAMVLPCAQRAIISSGLVIAGIIAEQVRKWLKQEDYARRISFDLKTMSLVTTP